MLNWLAGHLGRANDSFVGPAPKVTHFLCFSDVPELTFNWPSLGKKEGWYDRHGAPLAEKRGKVGLSFLNVVGISLPLKKALGKTLIA